MEPLKDFDIQHKWRLETRPEELTDIVLDTACYDKWCARILLAYEIIAPGDAQGRGLSLRFHTKGWLPYSFLFTATIVDLVPHAFMKLKVEGDFEGFGYTEITGHDTTHCDLNLRWHVDVKHPLLRALVPVFRMVMRKNHIWAVNWVGRMMQAEVHRRRQRLNDFAAPPPTFRSVLAILNPGHKSRARRMGWASGPGVKAVETSRTR